MTTTINADNVTGGAVVTGDSSGELGLQTAGTTRMTITSAGNVGIGTSSPGALLHVSADAAKIRVGVTTSSQYTDIYRDNATGYTIYNAAQASPYRAHVWQLGGTEAARINYDGNVGIGTASVVSPARLDITKSTTNNDVTTQRQLRIGGDTNGAYSLFLGYGQPVTGDSLGGTIQSLDNGSGSKLLLNPSGGVVLIGTSAKTSYGGKNLEISGVNQATPGSTDAGNVAIFTNDSQAADRGGLLALGGNYSGSTPYVFGAIAGRKSNSTSGNAEGYLQFFTTNSGNTATERMRITSSGDIQIIQTPGQYTSDVTLGAITIANNGTVDWANASGLLIVNDWSNAWITMYFCSGGATSVVAQLNGQVGTFAYRSAVNGYRWTNTSGGTITVGFFFVRTRNGA